MINATRIDAVFRPFWLIPRSTEKIFYLFLKMKYSMIHLCLDNAVILVPVLMQIVCNVIEQILTESMTLFNLHVVLPINYQHITIIRKIIKNIVAIIHVKKTHKEWFR